LAASSTSPGALRARPVTVAVVSPGRHLFEAIHDERVALVDVNSGPPNPSLVVFPCGHDRHFEKVTPAALPAPVRASVASGTSALVFDSSVEGVKHKAHTTGELHDAVKGLGASPLNCVYVTQDRGFEREYREYCSSIGFDPVLAILNYDYWIWYAFAQYEAEGERVFEQRLEAFRSRPQHRARRFLSLNRTARDAKLLFLLSLHRDGLWDKGFVSFGGFQRPDQPKGEKPRPTPEQLAQSMPGFDDKVAELAPFLDALDARGRVLLGMERHGWTRLELWNAGLAADLAEYDQSWFSVATETEMRPRISRITEKSLKPLANFHPMLVLGNPGSLQMVRSYGFATFEEIFDESYDDELDPRRRFDMVYGELTRLCRLDERELLAMERRVEDKLIFNARWGFTEFPGAYRRQRDTALVDQILVAVSRSARG
jgi:hypothetical protein